MLPKRDRQSGIFSSDHLLYVLGLLGSYLRGYAFIYIYGVDANTGWL